MVSARTATETRAIEKDSLAPAVGGFDRIKRCADFTAAALFLLLLIPLSGVIAFAIVCDSPGPVLFRQLRSGRHGKPFWLLKFRSMRVGTPNLPTDALARRTGPSPITRTGALLRRLSLDEIPQLWNILRGEMSFVGPRPALPTQEALLTLRRQSGADTLLPGLTGWAQVNGRDNLNDKVKAAFDADYMKLRSVLFDLKILVKTVRSVASGEGNR